MEPHPDLSEFGATSKLRCEERTKQGEDEVEKTDLTKDFTFNLV